MKTHNEAKWRRLVRESRMDEMATRWKTELDKLGVKGPYRLESGEMGGTDDVLRQYVVPTGEKPTHFIHFGKIEAEREMDRSKQGPQFKFGVNPTTRFSTPIGIYSYPLNQTIFDQFLDGTLPFAQGQPFIMLFKVAEGVPVIYTAEDIPLDEYAEYVEALLSDEMMDSERDVRYARRQGSKVSSVVKMRSPYDPPLDWLRQAREQPEDVPEHESLVRKSEVDTNNYLNFNMRGRLPFPAEDSKAAHLWGLVRNAAQEDPMRWNAIMRKLGIAGVVDDAGVGFIHPNEPLQAVFFTMADPERNLELVEVLPNTHTPEKIKRRASIGGAREMRQLVRELVADISPDPTHPQLRVTQDFIDGLITFVGLRGDDWMFNPTSEETDFAETLKLLKEEGEALIIEYLVHRYLAHIGNQMREIYFEWKDVVQTPSTDAVDDLLRARAAERHPAHDYFREVKEKIDEKFHNYRMSPVLKRGIETGQNSAREVMSGKYRQMNAMFDEYKESFKNWTELTKADKDHTGAPLVSQKAAQDFLGQAFAGTLKDP